jgi:GNAT superfamily N-acetyltransferase
MVFWSTIWDHLAPMDRSQIESPTGTPAILMKDAQEVQHFLLTYFRLHPDVMFDIPVNELQCIKDTVLTIYHHTTLVGCIRYHHIDADIRIVDCFCVHPEWRGKGVGDYLLHELHHMMHHTPKAIFIKEGSPLPIISLYSSTYVYCELTNCKSSPYVTTIPLQLAHKLMDIHQQFRPFFMLRSTTHNQTWKLYKRYGSHILCCVQNTYQRLCEKKIGIIKAWIESPGITDAMRIEASYQLSDSMYPQFDMIWMDAQWINTYGDKWIQDGPFYWYTYQWKCPISVGRSYCFME